MAPEVTSLRQAEPGDWAVVAAWIRSEAECRLWCGSRVRYPIDLAGLPDALESSTSESWTVSVDGQPAAFGQLVSKPGSRLHLARLISAPERRGQGLGRLITTHLLRRALERKPSVISLNVFAENEPAVTLYDALGFVPAEAPPAERAPGSVYMVYSGEVSVRGRSERQQRR